MGINIQNTIYVKGLFTPLKGNIIKQALEAHKAKNKSIDYYFDVANNTAIILHNN